MTVNPRHRVGIIVLTWVVCIISTICAGLLTAAHGWTIEAGYFWPRQLVIWGILVPPLLVTAALRRKR